MSSPKRLARIAGFLYLIVGKQIHGFLAIPPTIAEIWTLGYLLVRGCGSPPRMRAASVLRQIGLAGTRL